MSTSLLESHTMFAAGAATYSPEFRAALEQGGAWSAEARLVLALAAELHVALDEEHLRYSDVRDLQALRAALIARLGGSRRA